MIADTFVWCYALGSWCFCFYVFFASGEGHRWFSVQHNPLLLLGAALGAFQLVVRGVPPDCAALLLSMCGWGCYAVLVTLQHSRLRIWRHQILPVNAPLVALAAWFHLIGCNGRRDGR